VTTAAHHDYWDAFYASRASGVPGEPSSFARWVLERLEPGQQVVEFGFGTARDSIFFAGEGHPVQGFDFAQSAVSGARGQADAHGVPATFAELDLYDTAAMDRLAEDLIASTQVPALYGRFLLHSLEADGRTNLLDLGAKVLAAGGSIFVEFRTGQDQGQQHVFGDDHFRVYLDPAMVRDEIVARGGTVSHFEQGHGLAVYKSEDPHVARIVATWQP
jgi:hypothetical protein